MLITGLLFSLLVSNQYVVSSYYLHNSENYKSMYIYKYINNAWTSDSDFSNIRVGYYTQSGNSVMAECVLRYRFPSYNYQSISSAKLTTFKYSGSATIKVGYSYSHDFNNNPTLTNWTYLGNLSQEGNNYTLPITQQLKNAIQYQQQDIYFRLYVEYSGGNMTIGGNANTAINNPGFIVNYSEVPSYNTYGSATAFSSIDFSTYDNEYDKANCYGYALNGRYVHLCYTLFNGNCFPVNNITQGLNNIINNSKVVFNAELRLIDSYTSPIFPYERRIAFRYNNLQNNYILGSYHFIRQTNDGYWESVDGTDNPTYHHTYYNPENFDWGAPFAHSGKYNSDIYYFAVTDLGGHDYYVQY